MSFEPLQSEFLSLQTEQVLSEAHLDEESHHML